MKATATERERERGDELRFPSRHQTPLRFEKTHLPLNSVKNKIRRVVGIVDSGSSVLGVKSCHSKRMGWHNIKDCKRLVLLSQWFYTSPELH